MKSDILQLAVALGTIAVMTACSKDLGYSSYEENQKQTYADNFVAKYGSISPSQTWDFTTGAVSLPTRRAAAIQTEIMENGISFGDVSKLKLRRVEFSNHSWDYDVIEGGAEKNDALLTAITTVLPEKKQWNGKPAVLVAPASTFYIYPLFSGGNIMYDLKVKVGNEEPVTVFQKDYTNFQTINGMKKKNGEIVNMRGLRIQAPVGTPVEVYIDNLVSLEGKKISGAMGTTNGKAVYVDIPEDIVPELEDVSLKENAIVKYIGIEDVAAANSDKDYNDLVLAVVGDPDVPQEIVITNDQYDVTTCRTKRYMIEDLGATDDFDFNDVVIDVTENTVITHQVTYENGVKKSDEIIKETLAPSTAIIRAMGGTIDFTLTIGNTKWVKSENGFNIKTMYNTQGSIDYQKVLAEFEVTGWDYESNNISVQVPNEKSGEVFTINFPKAGTAPMIIAVDPTQNWMGERVSVPKSWFTE
jgi:hypothetical protein